MKRGISLFIVSLLTIVAIMSCGLLIKHYLQKTSNELISSIDTISQQISSGYWDMAYDEILKLDRKWSKIENTWGIIVNHHEIDNITISLKTAIEYIDKKDDIESASALTSLKYYIEHIPEMEAISPKNIF